MKKRTCYALFIGINAYYSPQIPPLDGCIRDAKSLLTYIQDNLNKKAYDLKVVKLFTGTANPPTRENIINHICQHLGKANAQQGDMALLFYAGHGSKERAHPSFNEADGNLQTLVPCDARTTTPNGTIIKNILDKELRFLFHHLWKNKQKPDLVFIQDSCHSTGASRKDEQLAAVTKELLAVETILAKEDNRTIELNTPVARFTEPTDYEKSGRDWETHSIEQLTEAYTAFKLDEQLLAKIVGKLQLGNLSFDKDIPLAQHIHFAACGKNEFAHELSGIGGVFTAGLVKILKASQNTISYHDLFNRIRMNIAGVYQQTPDLLVSNPDYTKRHEPFLGDLLKRGELTPYRDMDVFNGFSPVFYEHQKGWKIKAGEMELLPNLNGKIKAIPIEVFLQDQKPKGKSNAIINYVGPNFSKITFTTINVDEYQYANKLYAMIPPQYLRRWRVPVWVERAKVENNFEAWFNKHPLRKKARNSGKLALNVVSQKASAHYLVKELDKWYYFYQKDGSLIFQCTAARYTNKEGFCGILQKPNDSSLYKVKNGKESILDEEYELIAPTKDTVSAILSYLLEVFKANPRTNINLFFEQEQGENAFVKFQQKEAKTLDYYTPFMAWIEDKAEYIVRTEKDGFAVYAIANGTVAQNPAFRKTEGTSTKDGYRIILSLQKMCKWRTILRVNNPMQLNCLKAHKFEFRFKLYTIISKKETDEKPHNDICLESWNKDHYISIEEGQSKMGSGEFKAVNDFQKESIHFLKHPSQESVIQLQYDLDIVHLEGQQNVYISTLLLDSNFGISPLQLDMGNNLLPPKRSSDSSLGTLSLQGLTISKSNQMRDFPQDIQQETFYLKIFIAYSRFDISGLLQGGLPAAVRNPLDKASAKPAKRVRKPPKAEDTGSWMAFTIPISIK